METQYPGSGIGCTCAARHEGDCCCEADWTPIEVYELQEKNSRLRARIKQLENILKRRRKKNGNMLLPSP